MVTRVQTKAAIGASGTSAAVTISSTAGNTLVIVADAYSSTNTAFHVSSITDGHNTWTFSTASSNANPPVGQSWDGSFRGLILIGAVVNAAAVTSVTVNFSASLTYVDLIVYEFSGVPAGSSIVAANASSTLVTAASVTTPPVTVPASAALAVAAQTNIGNAGSNTTVSSGWTTDTSIDTDRCSAWRVSPAAGSLSATFTSTSSQDWLSSAILVIGAPAVTGSGGTSAKKPAPGGSGTAAAPGATGSGGVAARKAALSGSGTAGIAGSGGLSARKAAPGGSGAVHGPVGFPYKKLGVKAELLLGGTWTDITAYVQLRNDISISPFGRANESNSMQAAQVTLTLKNISGRFTPGNASGAYYPYIQLNTQIRISVSDVSVNGTAYSGYRFWGEVSDWPSAWDESGRDVYAEITAAGIWDRLSRSTKRIGSPYTRYNTISVAGAWTLASYHPMEDGQGSATFANLVAGQAAMTVTSGTPTLASASAFNGSDALPVLNGAVLNGLVSTSAHPSSILWRFGLELPSGGDRNVPAGAVLARMTTSGTVARVEVSLGSPAGGGPLTITGYNASGTQLFTGSSTLSTWGIPMLVQVSLAQSGGNVNWGLRTMLPGAATANTTVTGSITGTVDDTTGTVFNLAGKYQGTAVGQSVVIYGNPVITDASAALAGWPGEFAGARFLRICSEQGIPAVLTGSSTSGTTMGPQVDDTLSNVLTAIEATDGGELFETRTQFGLGYRTLATLQDQGAPVTLDYNSGQLFTPLVPVTDAALIRNDVTLTNYDGYAVRAYLASGARSVQSPPNGAGAGYEYTGSVSSTSHAQVQAVAQQILNSGTVSDPRYPTVTVNLAAPGTASLFGSVPGLGVGDYLQLVNLPAYGGAATQKQLVWGWTETLSVKTWTITFNTIPEAPYESSYVPGTAVSGQVPGSPTTFSQAGSVSGAQIAESAVSLFSLAQQVLTYQFGGITSNISSAAPSNPADGDLWFDSGNGFQIKRWDATAGSWVPVTFDGSNILGAGTITAGLLGADAVVAGNIAAGVVTATQLAAGIVMAGIVDGTTISGAQFVAHGASGEILVYSGTPAAGNLIMSVSAMAGSDGFGNAYQAGVYVYNSSGGSIGLVPAANTALVMTPGVTPAPVAGSPQMFANAAGHALVQDGADGQTYQTQRRTLFNTVASGTLTALAPVFTTTCGNATYRVHGQLYINATVSGWQFTCEIAGSGSLTGQFGYTISHGGGTNAVTQNGGPNASVASGVNMGAGIWVVTIDGLFTQTVANALQLQCGSATATGFIVDPYSFFEVMPV